MRWLQEAMEWLAYNMHERVFGTEKEKKKRVKMSILSGALGCHTVDSISSLKSKLSLVKLPKGQTGYKSSALGFSQMEGSQPQQILLDCAFSTKLLTSIKVYHGAALDGLEFFYEEATSQLFGNRGGKPGGDEFVLGEYPALRNPRIIGTVCFSLSCKSKI